MPVPHSDVSGAVVQFHSKQVGEAHTVGQEECVRLNRIIYPQRR